MLRVAFVGALAASFSERVRAHLTVPCELMFSDEQKIVAQLPEVDVLVTLAFTASMGGAGSRLRLVQVPGAGLDRIDRAALPPAAALANVYGHEPGIAEYILGAMLAQTRSLVRLDSAMRRGVWESQWTPGVPTPPPWAELAGRTLGIVGYGRIGQALANRARAFDMRIAGIRRDVQQSANEDLMLLGGLDRLEELLRISDYVALTVALSPATRGLIGAREIAFMKPSAMLINVARGEVVDENALYEALATRRIAGAALDVWYQYPKDAGPSFPSRRPFHELDNVLMTPHVSGWTDGTLESRAKLIAENIRRTSLGLEPLNRIPPPA